MGPQRIISTMVVTAGAFLWQLYRESESVPLQEEVDASIVRVKAVVWPPSPRSAPFLSILILNFAALIKKTFFSVGSTEESKRVRDTKRRLLLAQMAQALKWNVEDVAEADEQEDHETKSDGEKKKRRPPAVADLFD